MTLRTLRALATSSRSGATAGGMAAGSRVLTRDGESPVEWIMPGDKVVTRDAGLQPVLAVESRVVTSGLLVRVAAGALGVGRPGAELLLAPDQAVLLRDWRARALYGLREALVPVARLADGAIIASVAVRAPVRLFTLHLARRRILYADGMELSAEPVEAVAAG